MTIVLIILTIVVIGLLIFLFRQPANFEVDRSLLIDAPVKQVFQTIRDFKTWPKWSPWLMHEPDCKLEYSDDYQQPGGSYQWDGKLVGAGSLTHADLQDDLSIDQRIEFLRPFKSSSEVSWTFDPHDEQTRVHWIMRGSMPFLFRFMTPMMTEMISKDYDLGLNLLNGYLNPETEHPSFEFKGKTTLDDFCYARKTFSGSLDQLKQAMQEGFPALYRQTSELNIVQGLPLSVYHKVDLKKDLFVCDIAIPVNCQDNSANLDIAEFKGGLYYQLDCQGDYRFLGLAWYKIYSHCQMLKLKIDKKRPSLEVYLNDPREVTHSNEIKTSLYIPIKRG